MSRMVSLGEVVSITARQVDPRNPMFQDLPLVNGENIEPGTGRLLYRRSAVSEGVISPKYLFQTGEVLYSKLRPYLRKAVLADGPGLCSADMYPLRPTDGSIEPSWLVFLLLSPKFTDYASRESARARMPKLNREQLLRFRFIRPDIETQRSIAVRLTEQLVGVASASGACHERASDLDGLRELVYRRAFEMIVPLAAERSHEIEPTDSSWVRLGEVASAVRGVAFASGHVAARPGPGLIACLTTSAVQKELDWGSARYIPDNIATSDQILRSGDLVVSTANSSSLVGRAALVEEAPSRATFGAFVTVLRPGRAVEPTYLNYWLRTSTFLREARSRASQTTSIANLRVSDLLAMELPLPAAHEQRRIVSELGSRLAMIDTASTALDAQLTAIGVLPAALLRSAFENPDAA